MQLKRNPNLTTSDVRESAVSPLYLPCTGASIEGHEGVVDGRITSLAQVDPAVATRAQVQAYFDNTWLLTEVLFSGLATEDALFCAPYHNLRHPLAFYYGHTAALYLNKLQVAGLLSEAPFPELQALFETGVDEMTWDVMEKNTGEWPAIEQIVAFRSWVYSFVTKLIAEHPDLAEGHAPIGQDHPLWALFLAFEHERIHLETSAILVRELPADWLRRPAAWPVDAPTSAAVACPKESEHYPATTFSSFDAAPVDLGKPAGISTFGWDNEYGNARRWTNQFSMANTLVSNGAFVEFVRAGGYRERKYWSEIGWDWRSYRNTKWPAFWLADGPAGCHRYKLRTTFEVIEMQWQWPVMVTHHEAKAFAAWRSQRDNARYRLPTEAELARVRTSADPVLKNSGVDFQNEGINLNFAFGSTTAVDAGPGPIHDLAGNLWTWCEDDFHPLNGAAPHPFYEDFSEPCYDGEHAMILGGSFLSTGNEASRYARFHFRPHFLQAAGIRLVAADGDGAAQRVVRKDSTDKYDQGAVLGAYLDLHFGEEEATADLPAVFQPGLAFPSRCAKLLVDAAKQCDLKLERVLDLGCATGRASFDIAAATGAAVTGIDLSQPFIDACQAIQASGELAYQVAEQGDLRLDRVARIPKGVDPTKLTFLQGDATHVPLHLRGADGVLMANLIDRLQDPAECLRNLGGDTSIVRVGGVVVLTSPYTWMRQFTDVEKWLGGFKRDGKRVRTLDVLTEVFASAGFRFLSASDQPLIIREHQRKYELVVAQATVWQRVE